MTFVRRTATSFYVDRLSTMCQCQSSSRRRFVSRRTRVKGRMRWDGSLVNSRRTCRPPLSIKTTKEVRSSKVFVSECRSEKEIRESNTVYSENFYVYDIILVPRMFDYRLYLFTCIIYIIMSKCFPEILVSFVSDLHTKTLRSTSFKVQFTKVRSFHPPHYKKWRTSKEYLKIIRVI